MKIAVLMENTGVDPSFHHQHGLCLYVESGERKILFDFGRSDAFAGNAQLLGIDLSQVDLAVLSHGHYDHGGGIAKFCELNDHAPIYADPGIFGEYYHGQEKYIGLDQTLREREKSRFVFCPDEREIAPGVTILKGKRPLHPIVSWGLTCRRGDHFEPDRFDHEQYLLIEEEGKRILLSGCSHRGILNIASWYRPDVLIGGFHLMAVPMDEQGRELVHRTADELLSLPCRYYTCHCTGQEQYALLEQDMGRRISYLRTGMVVNL